MDKKEKIYIMSLIIAVFIASLSIAFGIYKIQYLQTELETSKEIYRECKSESIENKWLVEQYQWMINNGQLQSK